MNPYMHVWSIHNLLVWTTCHYYNNYISDNMKFTIFVYVIHYFQTDVLPGTIEHILEIA